MSNLPSETPKSPASEPQNKERRLHPLLGLTVGCGALMVVLLGAALIGYILFSWTQPAPQAAQTPVSTPLAESTAAPPPGLTPTESATASPVEGLPVLETATPFSQETSSPEFTPFAGYVLIVKVNAVNIRTGPGTLYPVIITYPQGTRLLAVGRDEYAAWFAIDLSPEQRGWLSVPMVSYDFDRYLLPVLPAPPLPITTSTPYGSAVLVPPELRGSQPLAIIQPSKRLLSLVFTGLLAGALGYLERTRISRLARTSLRQVLIFGAHHLSL